MNRENVLALQIETLKRNLYIEMNIHITGIEAPRKVPLTWRSVC